ncbi:hypothetical protein GCM10010519_01840 [Streptomyces lactacystinicus]
MWAPCAARSAQCYGMARCRARRTSRVLVRRVFEGDGLADFCVVHGREGRLGACYGGVTSKVPVERFTVRFELCFGRSRRE